MYLCAPPWPRMPCVAGICQQYLESYTDRHSEGIGRNAGHRGQGTLNHRAVRLARLIGDDKLLAKCHTRFETVRADQRARACRRRRAIFRQRAMQRGGLRVVGDVDAACDWQPGVRRPYRPGSSWPSRSNSRSHSACRPGVRNRCSRSMARHSLRRSAMEKRTRLARASG